jgi:hypothetical protein
VVASQYGNVNLQTFTHLFVVDEPSNGGIVNWGNNHLTGEVSGALDAGQCSGFATLTLRQVGIDDTGIVILTCREEWILVAGAAGEGYGQTAANKAGSEVFKYILGNHNNLRFLFLFIIIVYFTW